MNQKKIFTRDNVIDFSKYKYEKDIFCEVRLHINNEAYNQALRVLEENNDFDYSARFRIDLLKAYLYLKTEQFEKAEVIMKDEDMVFLFIYTGLLMEKKDKSEIASMLFIAWPEIYANFNYDYYTLGIVLENTFLPMYQPFIDDFLFRTIFEYIQSVEEEKLMEWLKQVGNQLLT